MITGVPCLALTATATGRVERDICDALRLALAVRKPEESGVSQGIRFTRRGPVWRRSMDRPELALSVVDLAASGMAEPARGSGALFGGSSLGSGGGLSPQQRKCKLVAGLVRASMHKVG